MADSIPSSLVAIALLAVFCSFAALPSASAQSQLSLRSSLTPLGNQILVSSPGKNFSFGFRSLSQPPVDEFYLAIWYTNLDNTIVWMANRDKPVTRRASLNLTADGRLVLSDPSLAVSLLLANTSGVTAEIQDTGNFVLLNSSGVQVWQSFDNATDTLLPGQQLKGKAQLISRKTTTGYASGRYFLHFPTSGNIALSYTDYIVNQDFGADYWGTGTPTGDYTNSSSPPMLELNQSGNLSFSNSSGVYQTYVAGDFQIESTRRLTLDMDGNLRMYSWDKSSSSWTRVWFAVTGQCTNIKGLCGSYGICIYNPEPACVCPPGFHVADSSDLSGGCTPNLLPINYCNSSKYVVLDNTDFPFNDYSSVADISMTECIQSCSTDCNCLAAVYWQSGQVKCWLKRAQVLNGFSPQSQNARTFLKVSDSDQSIVNPTFEVVTHWTSGPVWQQPESPVQTLDNFINNIAANKALIAIFSAVIVSQLLGLGGAVLVLLRKNARILRQSKLQQQGDQLEGISGSPVRFSYQELEAATNNFSETLGTGGFGTVYKGTLANGRVVAVKLLEGVSQREKQFQAEIATIGRIHHINLLRLCGFCAEGDHRLLVYDYMENGSLDSILFHESGEPGAISLDWKTRFQICLGTARGISYLHEECLDFILHCDIKPQNILLDSNYCPKVADFGLAYLFSRDHTVKVTTIRGTRGYLAPEWVSNLPITTKADVFSFGMVLLEIVSGRSNYLFDSANRVSDRWCFPVWAFQQLSKGTSLEVVLDPRLNGNVDYEQVRTVLNVAFCCIHPDVSARPSMGRVVQMLEGTVPAPEPPAPNLFLEGGAAETNVETSEEKNFT